VQGGRALRPPAPDYKNTDIRLPFWDSLDLKKAMDIADWRRKIDEIDRKLVELINQRAEAARAIGRLKRNTNMPIYEPDREKIIFDNVRQLNRGPLEHQDLIRVYERLIDVMRKIQKEEIVPKETTGSGDTELESEVND
jgi:chorismate mutase